MNSKFYSLALCMVASLNVYAAELGQGGAHGNDGQATPPTPSVNPWTCPVAIDGNTDKIGSAIEKSLSEGQLETAAQIARVCASFGSNLDVSLLSPVNIAFDNALKDKLASREGTTLNNLLNRCARKTEIEGGSLGRSMAAHCKLKVYEGFYAAIKK